MKSRSPISSSSWRAWLATSLLLVASALSACASGTRPTPELRYQENLLVKCDVTFLPLETDEVDDATRNHLTVVAKARECARRHNNLVDAIRGTPPP